MKKISTIILAIVIFTLNILGVSAQSLTFSYVDDVKKGIGDPLKPLFPMIQEDTQTPTYDDGSFIQTKIDSFNVTNKSVTVLLTLSNKIVEGKDEPIAREGIVAEILFDQIILDNFDIEYENSNVEDRTVSLLWNIGDIAIDEEVTLTYILTLKDNYSEDIIDKDIAVFRKTNITIAENDITYDKEEAKCSIPMFKLTLTDNPQTGINENTIIISLIGLSAVALVIYLKKNNKFLKI